MSNRPKPIPAEFQSTREGAKLSQTEAAELLGVHRNTIQNWEQGRRECHPAFLAYLKIKVEERQQDFRKILENLVRKHPANQL